MYLVRPICACVVFVLLSGWSLIRPTPMSKGDFIEEKEKPKTGGPSALVEAGLSPPWLRHRCGAPRARRPQDSSILWAVCPLVCFAS